MESTNEYNNNNNNVSAYTNIHTYIQTYIHTYMYYIKIEGCEWIVDGAFEKPQARIWYDVIKFLETDPELKYCRGKNIDAVPYEYVLYN